jgi:hypothetical protein
MAWMQYTAGRRFDPVTGEVQSGSGSTFKTLGWIKRDPDTGQYINPKAKNAIYGPPQGGGKPSMTWGLALPTREQLDTMYMMQGAGGGAAQAPGGAPVAGGSYLGQNPQIGGLGAGAGGVSAGPGEQPESAALRQMAQIDPATEALRQALASSYLTPLQQAGAPSAAQFQNELALYGQIDPTGLAARQNLESQLSGQAALGAQLDPVTMRQIEQQVRAGQLARGNVYGTPQMVEEAMTTGQAGLALQQQRQQALGQFLQGGLSPGDVALNLYNQQQAQLRAAQSAAGGYLGSGVTPYQAGASYLNTAEQRAAAAAQGGAVYNPQGQSGYYTGQGAASFPQYGLDISQLANQWQQSMNYGQYAGYNAQLAAAGGRGGGFSGAGAAKGAIGGAASGALAGAAAGGVGAIPGALLGAIGGGLGGAFSG